jgi:hypothetical protein
MRKVQNPRCDKIRITLDDGSYIDEVCRYVDDYHVEVGRNLYHICEFAERMEANGNKVIPLRSDLPIVVTPFVWRTGEMVIVKKVNRILSLRFG